MLPPDTSAGASQPVVGRDAELGMLRAFFGTRTDARALIIVGAAGIGKTTLWEAGISAAEERGARVLSTRAISAESRLSFAGLCDLLDEVPSEELAQLPTPQLQALDAALLRAPTGELPPEPRAVALALLTALRLLGRDRRLVVAIDDAPWLDVPSSNALTFAARRLEGYDVRFLLARRPGSATALERAFKAPQQRRLDAGPLTFGAMRRLLADRLDFGVSRPMFRRIVDVTQGNPLFALEVGRALVDQGPDPRSFELPIPDRVDELLGLRIGRLRGPVRRALLAVSLSGDLTLSRLLTLADARDVHEAAARRVLVVEGERVRPAHPLLAAKVTQISTAEERRAMHAELAACASEDEARARHLALAATRTDAELAELLTSCAARAAARGAPESAVELAEHALRLTPEDLVDDQSERRVTLASYLLVVGDHSGVKELLDDVQSYPPSARARAHLLLAESTWSVSHADRYGEHLELALEASRGDPALQASVTAARVRYAVIGRVEQIASAESWAAEQLPAATAAGGDVERELLHGLGWARVLRGRSVDDLRERFDATPAPPAQILRSLDRIAAERHANRGELAEARRILCRLAELADERGEHKSFLFIRLQQCEVELRAGRWDEASRITGEWESSLDDELIDVAAYERCRGLLAFGRGDFDLADRYARQAIAASEARALRWNLLEAQRVRGVSALFARKPHKAAEDLRSVWEHTQREGVDDPGVFPVAPDLIEALVELDEQEEARAVLARLRELAMAQEHPWGLATVSRGVGLVGLAGTSYDERADVALREATNEYARLGLRFDAARSLLLLGRARRRHRKWGAARASLEQAVAAFDAMGSPGWAAETRSELSRVGARKPSLAGQLSPAEERAAHLAAEGLSNKEIARALFVSVKTVEAHLSHAYRKLGVRSRSQLAGQLDGKA